MFGRNKPDPLRGMKSRLDHLEEEIGLCRARLRDQEALIADLQDKHAKLMQHLGIMVRHVPARTEWINLKTAPKEQEQ